MTDDQRSIMNINEAIKSAHDNFESGNLEQAEFICKEILKENPLNADALQLLGVICYHSNNYDSAIQYFDTSLRLNPDNFEAYYNLGIVLQEKGDMNKAITSYQQAIQLNPGFSDAYYNLGMIFQGKKQLNEAVICYQKAIILNPLLADAYNNLGVIVKETGQIEEAISYYQKAIEVDPYFADAYNNLGNVIREKKQHDKAIFYYRKALELNPNFVDAYINLGNVLQEKNNLDNALECFQKAILLNPENADAHWNKSLAFLLSGNYKEGWKEYEWRLKVKDFLYLHRDFPRPVWDGSDITGKTILLHAEQGFGDTIQFIRYAPLVREKGAKVIVECQKELAPLMRNIEGIHRLIVRSEQLPEFDLHYPLLSLPLQFDTTLESIPAKIPYISADKQLIKKWREKVLPDNSKLKVGIVWSGNPDNIKIRSKSCSLEAYSPFADLDDVTFYSLQKGKAAEQVKHTPAGMKLIDYTEELKDFADTAALIENLDLVISVDTAVAHLAGALGKPVWTLLPFAPDWRWMLQREDSPWYPSMRLFRQSPLGEWQSVIARITKELKVLLHHAFNLNHPQKNDM